MKKKRLSKTQKTIKNLYNAADALSKITGVPLADCLLQLVQVMLKDDK